MALPLGKITVIIGAGIVGSILTKEGRFSNVSDFFSGAFKIFKKHLQEDKSSSTSAGKPQNDYLMSQVNNLRQQLQMLQSSGSVTIITKSRSGAGPYSVTTIVIVGAVGYGYIWWKGWKLSDIMFVTRRGLSDACNTVAKQLELVSSSISSAKQHLSSRIDRVDCNLEDCMELTAATKDEVSKLQGDLSGFHVEVESVHRAVQTLETKLGQIEGSQDITTKGLYYLCGFAKRLEQSENQELIQASSSSSSLTALELPEAIAVTRTTSLPPRISAIEPSSPSPSTETPKVLLQSKAVSASGLKELQGISSVVKAGNFRSRSNVGKPEVSNGSPVVEEPSSSCSSSAGKPEVSNGSPVAEEPSSSSSSSGRFGWKLPSLGLGLLRTQSAADNYR